MTAGWEEAKGYEGMLEECETFLDMEKKGSYAPVDEEDFDREAALEALTKTGTIDDVFQFMKKEEDDDDEEEDVCHDGFWSVSCQNEKSPIEGRGHRKDQRYVQRLLLHLS